MTPAVESWPKIAQMIARNAHENFFSSPRGVYYETNASVLVVYHHHPHGYRPDRRDVEFADLKTFCQQQAWPVLAETSYPLDGPSAGYTRVLVVQAPKRAKSVLAERYTQITNATDAGRPPPKLGIVN